MIGFVYEKKRAKQMRTIKIVENVYEIENDFQRDASFDFLTKNGLF